MANINCYNGKFLKCIKDIGPFKQGEEYQLLLDRWGACSFVGYKFAPSLKEIGKYFDHANKN